MCNKWLTFIWSPSESLSLHYLYWLYRHHRHHQTDDQSNSLSVVNHCIACYVWHHDDNLVDNKVMFYGHKLTDWLTDWQIDWLIDWSSLLESSLKVVIMAFSAWFSQSFPICKFSPKNTRNQNNNEWNVEKIYKTDNNYETFQADKQPVSRMGIQYRLHECQQKTQ